MDKIIVEDIDFEDWILEYQPIKDSYGDIRLFETYGEDVKVVKEAIPERKVWTLVSGDYGDSILSGWHFVNRVGYYITEKSFVGDKAFYINMESEPND